MLVSISKELSHGDVVAKVVLRTESFGVSLHDRFRAESMSVHGPFGSLRKKSTAARFSRNHPVHCPVSRPDSRYNGAMSWVLGDFINIVKCPELGILRNFR